MKFLLLTVLLCAWVLVAKCKVDEKTKRARADENAFDRILRLNGVDNNKDAYSLKIPKEMFEGDIVMTNKLRAQIGEMRVRSGQGMAGYDAIRGGTWPGGVVPYRYASGFAYGGAVQQAIAEYNAKTCIRFKPYTAALARTAGGYVTFMHGGGCYSMIGRQRSRQQISLGRGCGTKGVAIHEMMHALGFYHEQSRRDRDSYITINWNSINRRMWYNFQLYRVGQADTLGVGYDKSSIMHYGNYAFSINRQKTIVSKSNPNERLGQRRGLSSKDVTQLRKYYKCSGGGKVTTTKKTGCNKIDNYPFCRDLKSYCGRPWVRANCKKACNICPTPRTTTTRRPSNCRDNNRNCAGWAKYGYCRSNGYTQKNCKKACKLC